MNTITEKIRAEIERRIETYKKGYANGDDSRADALELLLSFLGTLEEPEEKDEDVYSVNEAMQKFIKDGQTDVEQERRFRAYKAFWDAMDYEPEPVSEELEKEAVSYCFDNGLNLSPRVATDFARHFYELGHKEEPVCVEFEEEWKRYMESRKDDLSGHAVSVSIKDVARHFAKWQKEQDTRDMFMSDNRHFEKVYELGKKDMKEQMMQEAVEGEVCGRVFDHINVRFADGICKFLEPKNISHIPADVSKYKVGDKVKIIIVKED